MASFDGLRQKLIERAEEVARDAVDGLERRLDQTVPVKTGTLRDSRYHSFEVFPDRIVATIGYSADHALWTDKPTDRHPIPLSPGRLDFWWEREGRFFSGRNLQIEHPGNVNSQSLNWFSQVVNQENFSEEVRNALRS
jgi:hypothetical protein